MDARIDYDSLHDAMFLFGIKKFPPAAAIVDDIFMIQYRDLITRSNFAIPYLAQNYNQHPVQAALRIFNCIA